MRALAGAGVTAALAAAAPSAAQATALYGISDTGLDLYGGSASLAALKSGMGLRFARRFMPYDSFASSNGSSCISTESDPNNTQWHGGALQATDTSLYNWVHEAYADGLTPMISITGGVGNLTAENGTYYPSTPTDAGYKCGLNAAIAQFDAWGIPIHQWEAFNEPDNGLCASTAAAYYNDANYALSHNTTGHSGDQLVAGAFKDGDDPSTGSHPGTQPPSD